MIVFLVKPPRSYPCAVMVVCAALLLAACVTVEYRHLLHLQAIGQTEHCKKILSPQH